MFDEIGEAAGKVWAFLDAKGGSSASAIVNGTGLPVGLVHRAIGWLAREDKIELQKVKGKEMVQIRR